MLPANLELAHTVQQIIEFIGTFAFAISGIRMAAAKHFDWFGGFVCGFAVAIGGGTIRDVMLGATPFWMTSTIYIICTIIAMGCITGVAGGIIRDVLLNQEPVIFQKDIYAMASVAGGLLYWLLFKLEVNVGLTSIATFLAICCIRFLAIKYHISLPILRDEFKDNS